MLADYLERLLDTLDARDAAGGELPCDEERRRAEEMAALWITMTSREKALAARVLALRGVE